MKKLIILIVFLMLMVPAFGSEPTIEEFEEYLESEGIDSTTLVYSDSGYCRAAERSIINNAGSCEGWSRIGCVLEMSMYLIWC